MAPSDTASAAATVTDETELVARLEHPRAIRWMHWINFPLLVVMLWSGLRIYWANDVYAVGVGGWEWFAFFPEGFYEFLDLNQHLARGIAFHFSFGWLFALNGLAYAVYLAVSGEWRSLAPGKDSFRRAWQVLLHDLHLRDEAPEEVGYNSAQRLTYTIVLGMAAVLVVSGFAIYKPVQLYPLPLLFGGYQGARLIHFVMAIGLVGFFVIHIVQVARAGWSNLRSMITGYVIEPRGDTDAGESRSTAETTP